MMRCVARNRSTVGPIVLVGLFMVFLPFSYAADHSSHKESPGWAEQLKGQTIREDAIEGRAERTAMVARQHERAMEQMSRDAHAQHNSGGFNQMSMLHQYGAGGQDALLMSHPGE